jgi:hypothetical protein
MDDDLMSLRGGASPAGGTEGSEPTVVGGSAAPPPAPKPPDDSLGLGLEGFDAPVSKPAAPTTVSKPAPAPKKKKPAPKKTSGGGGFLGLTPQQAMLLSVFLFLDVAVLGCLVLIALGAIKI